MTEIASRLKDELLQLSDDDRVELARALWDSISSPDDEMSDEDALWIAELDRRTADLEARRAIAEPVDKVFADLRDEAMRDQRSR